MRSTQTLVKIYNNYAFSASIKQTYDLELELDIDFDLDDELGLDLDHALELELDLKIDLELELDHELDRPITMCCIFRPVFGCCAHQTLVKIVIFSFFCAKKP